MRGLTCSAFPAGVFALPSNQQLEATIYLKPTFTITKKRTTNISGSFFTSAKILLSQPLLYFI
ncbi:hypothetical protein E7L53_13300 [Priestia megaterium]|nr:hypothetical protein [Priestia megaterium]QCY28190.1 hypothetical protein EQG57_06315 [Priestia megaterium NBRC 15308 = ATCC 14581]THJ41472.1 hypothetical protein E7L53_13300 [Priestia megaterium]